MQPLPSTSKEESFYCRSCYTHQPKEKHSLKQCLKSKRDALQAIEDRLFGRESFIQNNICCLLKKVCPPSETQEYQSETQSKAPEIQLEKPEAVFKRPRVLRRRKIAPWSYTSLYVPKNDQLISVCKKPAVYNSANLEETRYRQPLNGGRDVWSTSLWNNMKHLV